MTRETKVGLLIGLGVILLIGIIVSDHLSVVQQREPAELTEFAHQAQKSINPMPNLDAPDTDRAQSLIPPRPHDNAIKRRIADEQSYGADDSEDAVFAPEDDSIETRPPIPMATKLAKKAEPVEPVDRQVRTLVLDGAGTNQHDLLSAPPPARLPGSESIHYVKPNEYLYHIAEKYYGDGELWRQIQERNSQLVDAHGRVLAGARLVIPPRSLFSQAKQRPDDAESGQRVKLTPTDAIAVKAGDTLSSLAEKHLGSFKRWREFLTTNGQGLKRAEDLKPGMVLKLPKKDSVPTPAAKPEKRTPENVYVVQSGDNLTRIAERRLGDGARWSDIYEANRDRLASADQLTVGQQLVLPD